MLLNIIICAVSLVAVVPAVPARGISNDVPRPNGGGDSEGTFGPTCRTTNSISKMVSASDIIVEAGVVAVTPPRNNIYAVTLKVQRVLKDDGEYKTAKTGQRLQLLFIKPKKTSGRPELRSLGTAKSYLEACIYEMDLKVGKKYNLFLNSQTGKMTGGTAMARFAMTGPPVLATRLARRKIKMGIKGLKSAPISANPTEQVIKSLDVKRSKAKKDGKVNLKLICRTSTPIRAKDQVFWTKDGERLSSGDKSVLVRSKKYKSVLKLKSVDEGDTGVYACNAKSSDATFIHRRSFHLMLHPTTTTTTTSTTTTTTTTTPATTTTTTTTASTSTSAPTPLNPAANLPCPVSGYCLNDGKCSFIPWLGELSCSCAPGFMGARCERKTTSALYSSLSSMTSKTLCAFGFGNPYHNC